MKGFVCGFIFKQRQQAYFSPQWMWKVVYTCTYQATKGQGECGGISKIYSRIEDILYILIAFTG